MTLSQICSRLAGRTPAPLDCTSSYAVLVPLVEREGQLHVLYELRAASLRRQPHEVCFPGGRMDPGESPEECALRETWEELSIPPEAVQVIAPLDFICHRSGFLMYPILARVDADAAAQLACSPAEVEEAFFVPLEALRAMDPVQYRYELHPVPDEQFPYELIGIPRNYPWQKGAESGPVYPWQGKAIWGLTARITRHLLELTQP